MPSPVLNVVSGVEETSSPRNGLAPSSPMTPPNNADVTPLIAAPMRRASASTPPLLQRSISYSIQLPPSFAAAAAANPITQQLPPACGARQLSKLKRFLTTLMQFGDDISSDVGDQVRSLILALVNSAMSTEEFHSKLQETTNFPLRPFVIPFLKTNLPFLQRELLQCARLSSQYPDRYLNLSSSNPPAPPPHPPHLASNHPSDSLGPPPSKRPAPLLLHSSPSSSLAPPPLPPPPQEQHIPPFHGFPHRRSIPTAPAETALLRSGSGIILPPRGGTTENDIGTTTTPPERNAGCATAVAAAAEAMMEGGDADSPTPHPFEGNDVGERREERETRVGGVGDEQGLRREDPEPQMEREIYYVYHLLSTVSVMMEKARLSLHSIKSRNSLLDRGRRGGGGGGGAAEPSAAVAAVSSGRVATSPGAFGEKNAAGIGGASSASTSSSSSSETAQDLSSYSSSNREAETREMESTDDSLEVVINVESANTAVARSPSASPRTGGVSGKMVADVERAIDVVQAKTAELIADVDAQRTKVLKRRLRRGEEEEEEGEVDRMRSSAEKEGGSITSSALKASLESIATESEDAAMFCWNCGREANETCSGCNKAKYCGSFCQHKDWENHHRTCAQLLEPGKSQRARESSEERSTEDQPTKEDDKVEK